MNIFVRNITMTPKGKNPSFLLRGVQLESFVDELLSGKHKDVQEVPKSSVSSSLVSQVNEEATSDRSSERLSIAIGRYTVSIVTTEQRVVNAHLQGQKPKIICKWCRLNVDDEWVGIPVNYVKESGEEYFYTTGTYCCYSCAYAHLRRILSQYRSCSHGSKYINSEQFLKYLFHCQYPDKELFPSPEWDLLEDNGGPLNHEEFFSSSSKYIPIPSMKIVPTKSAYWKMKE